MTGKRVVKNGVRGSQQVYMNKVKFDPYRYKLDDQKLPSNVVVGMTSLCCRRCCDILRWKVSYGKYIPLERHRKCNRCHNKTVALAYHRICQECATETACCAKCQRRPNLDRTMVDADHSGSGYDEDPGEEDGDESEIGAGVLKIPVADKPSNGETTSKYSFVDEKDSDEEFKPLRGLDIRQLKQRKRKALHQQEKDRIIRLRERERRTVLRHAAQQVPSEADAEDSDEEL